MLTLAAILLGWFLPGWLLGMLVFPAGFLLGYLPLRERARQRILKLPNPEKDAVITGISEVDLQQDYLKIGETIASVVAESKEDLDSLQRMQIDALNTLRESFNSFKEDLDRQQDLVRSLLYGGNSKTEYSSQNQMSLALCHKIVEHHQGKIGVESTGAGKAPPSGLACLCSVFYPQVSI